MAALLLGAVLSASLLMSTAALARPGAVVAPTATKMVSIKDFFFSPKALTVAKGTRVKWTNMGSVTHTTTSNTGLWSKMLPPGQSFSRVFNTAGTFKYHCMIHPTMTGKIQVTG